MDTQKQTLIIFGTIFFIVLFLMFVFFVLIFKKKTINKKSNILGFNIFFIEIDLNEQRIKRNNEINAAILSNLNKDDFLIEKILPNGWISLSQFGKNLGKEENAFFEAIEFLKINKSNVSFELNFSLTNSKFKNSNWFIDLNWVNDNLISGSIRLQNSKEINLKTKILTTKNILQNSDTFNLFICFNLVNQYNEVLEIFLKTLENILKKEQYYFLIIGKICTIFVSCSTYEKINKSKQKILKKLKNKKNFNIIQSFATSYGVVEAKNINNKKDLVKIINRIYFSLIKSNINQQWFFFDLKNIYYNEFEDFKKNIEQINNLISNNEIDIRQLKIKNLKTKEDVFNYYKPLLKLNDNIWTNQILKINYFSNTIKDCFAKLCIFNQKENKSGFIIDINDYFLKENIDDIIKRKNNIYIINLVKTYRFSTLKPTIELLQKYNIKFGIKIDLIDDKNITLIESFMPNVVIYKIKKENYEFFSKDILIAKSTILINVCKKNNIILIYQNIENDLYNLYTNKANLKTPKYYISTT